MGRQCDPADLPDEYMLPIDDFPIGRDKHRKSGGMNRLWRFDRIFGRVGKCMMSGEPGSCRGRRPPQGSQSSSCHSPHNTISWGIGASYILLVW
jgi:hypothetical protein